MFMNEIDEIAHVIQLSIAPVFLLTGVGTLLNVLSGRLARIIDRARVLEQRLETSESPWSAATLHELHVLVRRGKLINQSIKISTISALLTSFLIAALFASSMLHYSTHLIVSGFFVAVMVTCIVSLTLFLREVYLAIETFDIGLPAEIREKRTDRRMHQRASDKPLPVTHECLLQVACGRFNPSGTFQDDPALDR
jgi:hypothetical protein